MCKNKKSNIFFPIPREIIELEKELKEKQDEITTLQSRYHFVQAQLSGVRYVEEKGSLHCLC